MGRQMCIPRVEGEEGLPVYYVIIHSSHALGVSHALSPSKSYFMNIGSSLWCAVIVGGGKTDLKPWRRSRGVR